MKKLKVTELFYSIQGEGARAGCPSLFVRLAGCNLTCGFCDTEFESGKEFDLQELVVRMIALVPESAQKGPVWIVWTGGEPGLQLTDEVVQFFRERNWLQAVETNGSVPLPDGLDWVACSPKVAEHVLEKSFPNGVHELRYVRHTGQPGVPQPRITAKRYFLSPMFRGDQPDPANLAHCVKLCLENPQWNLSVQAHKLWRVL